MRGVMAVSALGLFGFIIWWVVTKTREHEDKRELARARTLPPSLRSLPEVDQEQFRLGLLMARFLDKSLEDPLHRTSARWEAEASELVSRFYDSKELQ